MAAELPTATTRRPRSDAVANRERVVAAAERLFRERGVEAVRMDDIAAAAGVGKGTLYRGFGDKSALVAAVLDGRERAFQDRVLHGEPPLGPGAPAAVRLEAFLAALAGEVEETWRTLVVSENSTIGARYRIGSYAANRLHLVVLLREAAPRLDAEWHADALLAPLAADLYGHQRTELGMGAERIRDGLVATARSLVKRSKSRGSGS
jgi:AcrR family transcriptional regulator